MKYETYRCEGPDDVVESVRVPALSGVLHAFLAAATRYGRVWSWLKRGDHVWGQGRMIHGPCALEWMPDDKEWQKRDSMPPVSQTGGVHDETLRLADPGVGGW